MSSAWWYAWHVCCIIACFSICIWRLFIACIFDVQSMATKWTESQSRAFWRRRRTYAVLEYPRVHRWRGDFLDRARQRRVAEAANKQEFFRTHDLRSDGAPSPARKVAQDLEFWAVHSSWSYCRSCKLLVSRKLLPSHARRPVVKYEPKCQCQASRYKTPQYAEIPSALRGLTFTEMTTLRPLDLHNGDYNRQQHGYRKKNSMTRVTWSALSVQEKINNLRNPQSKRRCLEAYEYLMAAAASSYRAFVSRREEDIAAGRSINLYNTYENRGIECALWPCLYPVTSWCETMLSGNDQRRSSKASFMTKVFSQIRDYSLHYDLLQFHFDRWLFNTVSGAISTAAAMDSSPARALETKTFSSEYWRWEHRFLVDALHQYGYPTLFVTINPYEWTFPFARWLEEFRDRTGKGPTELAAFETLNILNTLEQVVRGYLCGSNVNRWKKHLFRNKARPTSANVQCYFYRFEFQDRGTLHLHLLVWLKDVSKIPVDLINGHIPWEDRQLAFLVSDLQTSDKGALHLKNTPTEFANRQGKKVLELYHSSDAFALNLRAYITSVVPALKCRMDVQTTDGRSMLLRYVTSYVTKWQDAYSDDSLYSMHLTSYMAAYRHLREMTPCEPEMWVHLTARKIAWSNLSRKKFVPPKYAKVHENAICSKYWQRPTSQDDLSMREWLRTMNTGKTPPVPYKNTKALVGVKYLSVFNSDYFFQYILLNHPHRSLDDLTYPTSQQLPDQLKFFAAAVHLEPETWMESQAVAAMFEREGHKETFVQTVVSYVRSLHDVFNLWKLQVLSSTQLAPPVRSSQERFPVVGQQLAVLAHIKDALSSRFDHYSSVDAFDLGQEREDQVPLGGEENGATEHPPDPHSSTVDWTRLLLVKGKPGTGKTQVLLAAIQHCLDHALSVLVATPTGFLAARYRALFDNEKKKKRNKKKKKKKK